MSTKANREAIEYIMNTDKLAISASTAAKAIGMNPVTLRIKAREHPETLPFPVMTSGRNVKVARIPFMEYYGLNK